MRPFTIAGIDPGLSGGITFIKSSDDGIEAIQSFVMPTIELGTKHRLAGASVAELLENFNASEVYIEKVGAMPGQGVTSMFNFGYGSGILEGVCVALRLSHFFISPQSWMKEVLKDMPKDGTKSSMVYCQRRFPNVDWRKSERAKIPHNGKTDSCCIALYGLAQYLKTRSGTSVA